MTVREQHQVREAVAADSEGLKRCMQAAYAVYQQRMGGERLPPMDVDYASEIDNYPCWVIESQAEIVGALIMVFEDECASIANIAVDPQHQGRGIGGVLMAFAEQLARDRGYAELQLATHVMLDENVSLYQHLGWQEAGREHNKVFMKKAI